MKRMLLFPLVPALAWTQQVPSSEAEKALRDRVDQFYKLLVDKKYRQAEALVEEESKDRYYNWSKPDMRGFTVKSVELQEDGRVAKVTVTVSMVMSFQGTTPLTFEVPTTTTWHLDQSQWVLWIDPEIALQTPIGKIPPRSAAESNTPAGAAPDVDMFRNKVLLDRTEVRLTADAPEQFVTVINPLPSAVDLTLDEHSRTIPGLVTQINPRHVDSLGQTTIRFRAEKGAKVSDNVRITVSPINQTLEVKISAQ
jgi:hypothetical protein